MSARKHISPADGAYGHFNAFGAVVIDQIEEFEPEPKLPQVIEDLDMAQPTIFTLGDLTEEGAGSGKSRAVVHLAEDYTIYEDHGGNVIRSDSGGRLIVANQGSKDRMYDLVIALRNSGGTSLPTTPMAPIELPPRTQAVQEYEIAQGHNVLAITERITTHPEDVGGEEVIPNHLLVAGAETRVLFELKVTNTSGQKVEDLEVRKEIPEDFTAFELVSLLDGGPRPGGAPPGAGAQVKGSEIVWAIGALGPGTTASMRFTLTFTPTDVQPKPTGYIKASYGVSRNLSGVVLREYRALTKNIYSLRIEEVNEPGFWNCGMIFHNISEFPVLLTRAYVARTDTDTVFLDIKDYPKILQPDTTWESNSWQIKDADRPKLTNMIHFRVMPEVLASSRVRIIKEGSQLTIASLAGRKSYDKGTIPSYTETDVHTTIVLQNQGTGSLNELTIRDVIPTPLQPPTAGDVVVRLNEQVLNDTMYSLTLTPNDYDHLKNHTMAISLVNLKDTLGTFDPGNRITVEYTARAIRPEPETSIRGPVEMSGRGYPAGDRIVTQIPSEALPLIHVEHSLRKYTIGKAVEPLGEPGEYTIELLFQNDGKTPLKEVIILDPVPSGFTIERAEPEGARLAEGPDSAILWAFDELAPGDRMTFKYVLRGEGEYNSADTQVSFGA